MKGFLLFLRASDKLCFAQQIRRDKHYGSVAQLDRATAF